MSQISADYRKYKNILLWVEECKKYLVKNTSLSEEDFIKKMQSDDFVSIATMDGKVQIDIILTSSVSYIESSVELFRKVLKSVKVRELDSKRGINHSRRLIMVTKRPFSTNVQKIRNGYAVAITNYQHIDFVTDKRTGPMCYPHKVMAKEEVDALISFYHNKPSDYPSICLDDPQCIWLNARLGDLIEIHRIEDNAAGITVTYRYVISKKFDMSDKSKTNDLNLNSE